MVPPSRRGDGYYTLEMQALDNGPGGRAQHVAPLQLGPALAVALAEPEAFQVTAALDFGVILERGAVV